MVSINNDASGHSCFTSTWMRGGAGCSPGVAVEVRWWRIFNENERMVRDALDLIRGASLGNARCNTHFVGMTTGIWFWKSGGRTFDEVFNDPDIWISYHSRTGDGFLGMTSGARPKEITLSQDAFAKGLRCVAATLVHELAHVN